MTDSTIIIGTLSQPSEAHSLTGGLRFVERNGHMMLQQEWLVHCVTDDTCRNEWRDVPIAREEA